MIFYVKYFIYFIIVYNFNFKCMGEFIIDYYLLKIVQGENIFVYMVQDMFKLLQIKFVYSYNLRFLIQRLYVLVVIFRLYIYV